MARYIDADVLVENLKVSKEYQEKYATFRESKMTDFFIANVKNQPTADVEEVKHGYWKDRYGNKYDNHLYECSVCGKKALYEVYDNELGQAKTRQALTPACPYCFSKMDGERGGEK